MSAPPRLLAVDPGLPDCGAALYEDGVLRRCAWCRVAESLPRHQQLVALLDQIEETMGINEAEPLVVVVEWPRIYRPSEAVKGAAYIDANALLWLAGLAAALVDRAAAWGAESVVVTAPQWKGQLTKERHQRLHINGLDPEEQALLPLMPRARRPHSDALDAALLGRWYLLQQRYRREPLQRLPPPLPVESRFLPGAAATKRLPPIMPATGGRRG